MAKSSEEISKAYKSGARPDTNLSNDSLHLGGIPAEDFATHKYVQDYHGAKEDLLKQYIDEKDAQNLQQAKAYTDVSIANQDFSNFAKLIDLQTLDTRLTNEIRTGLNNQKEYTDNKVQVLDERLSRELSAGLNSQAEYTNSKVQDLSASVNSRFNTVNQSISRLDNTTQELFTSVSNGKRNVAAAITDKGVVTASDATFDTMATNIRKIYTGGEPDPNYVYTGDADAAQEDIMLGKTAYVKGQKVYGLHVDLDTSDANATQEDIVLGKTAYVNGQKVYGTHVDSGIDTSDATATPYDIVLGQTAYVNGEKITGILDLEGETPTYCSDTGIEKIYGGGTGDYSIKSYSSSPVNLEGILFNTNTLEFEASIYYNSYFIPNQISFYSHASDHMVLNNNVDITSINTHVKELLLEYDDYTEQTSIYDYIIGTSAINNPNPYIAMLCGTDGKKECILVILPVYELSTPSGGGYIKTWEIDFQNIIYQNLTSSRYSFSVSTLRKASCVSEDGTRITILGSYNDLNGKIIKINTDNFSITEVKNFSSPHNDSSVWIDSISTDRVIIYDTTNTYGSSRRETHIILLDGGQNFVRDVANTNKFVFTDDLHYCISQSGNIYSVNIDMVNYNVYYTLLDLPTINLLQYIKDRYSFKMIGNKFILTIDSNNQNNIILFDPLSDVALSVVETQNYNIDVSSYDYCKKLGNNVIFSLAGSFTRIMDLKKDFGQLVALKYQGEYFYRQVGGILTAGQPDVKKGKSFIGWMGYPEIGTMEVEE